MKKNNKGFSLVELIVVIAIMAILAAVAVVGFSLYIPKARQAADRQTISDTIDAFTLYYYSNPDGVTSGYVVLGPDGVVLDASGQPKVDAFGAAAMEAAFGENWQTSVKLQYADWQGMTSVESYGQTSYKGNESDLINTVDKLTTALGKVVKGDEAMEETLMGGGFGDFLEKSNVDTTNGKAIGNAAVLYVAQETKDKGTVITSAFNEGLDTAMSAMSKDEANPGLFIMMTLYGELTDAGVGQAAALAAIYAYAEGYAQASGQADAFHKSTDFSYVTSGSSAVDVLGKSLDALGTENATISFDDYIKGRGNVDLQGYIDTMGNVHNNREIVANNLNSENCFTDGKVENLLQGYASMSELKISTANGQVAIILTVDEDGNMKTHVAPLNWDK